MKGREVGAGTHRELGAIVGEQQPPQAVVMPLPRRLLHGAVTRLVDVHQRDAARLHIMTGALAVVVVVAVAVSGATVRCGCPQRARV